MNYLAEELENDARSRSDDPTRRAREDGLGLRDIGSILRRRLATIVITTAVIVGLASAYLFVTPEFYVASTQLIVDQSEHVTSPDGTTTRVETDAALVESQLRLIASNAVLGRVVDFLSLKDDPDFGGNASDSDERRTRAIAALSRMIAVRRSGATYVIEINAYHREAKHAKAIADLIASNYLTVEAEADRDSARKARESIGSRLDSLRAEVRRAEQRAQEYRQQNGIVGPLETPITDQQLGELSIRLVQARARVAEADARLLEVVRAKRVGADSGSAIEALKSEVVRNLRTQYATVAQREAELSSTLGASHPKLRTVRSELENVRKLINQELDRIAQSTKGELAVARANESALSLELEKLGIGAQSTNASLIELRDLLADVQASQQVYESYLKQSKEAREQEYVQAPVARILAAATMPLDPSFPPRNLLLALALFGGLGLGVALAMLREYMDDRVANAAQLCRLTRVDVVGVAGRSLKALALTARTLRNILRDGPVTASDRSAMVVSATREESGSLVALNLALAASVGGERVLLIDTDTEERTLSKLVAPDATVGLYEVLEDAARLSSAVVPNAATGLHILPVANSNPPSRRATRSHVLALVEASKAQFDYIVFDGGPLLADPDSLMVSRAVDQVILVARSGVTRHGPVMDSVRLMRMQHCKLRNAVLTEADAPPKPESTLALMRA